MAQTLFACQGNGDPTGDLFTVALDGTTTSVGALPEGVEAMAFSPVDTTGMTLYGTTTDAASDPDSLVLIDPTTGAISAVLATLSGDGAANSMSDLACDSSGNIWGLTLNTVAGHVHPVCTVALDGTVTAFHGASTGIGCWGFAIGPDGLGYMFGDGTAHLYTVDLATGSVTDLGAVTGFPASAGARGMTFDESGVLYAFRGASLFSIDVGSLTASFLGLFSDSNIGGMSWQPSPPPPPPSGPVLLPRWRFVVLDLATFEILSFLDVLASDRMVTPILNQPWTATGKVPADNPEINIPWPDPDSDPFLAEGTRVLVGLRREGTPTPWVVRFNGMLLQLEDDAQSDNAYTAYSAWDPWQYLFSRPVCNADGSLPGPRGLSFTATRVDVIAATLLKNTIINHGQCGIDAGATFGGTGFYTGTLAAAEAIDINFQQGTAVGQAWQQLCNGDYCDIILTPIYDPKNRPGYLSELNVYSQAGDAQDDAIFAWDMPSRSLVGIHRLIEGSKRANKVKFFAGQGGAAPGGQAVPVQTDAASVAKYGEYWWQQFLPNQTVAAVVEALAQAMLQLSKNGRTTVTISPAPQRAPSPFLEYFLGDRVPVYASKRFRQPIPQELAESSDNANYQRVYAIPIEIADDATEQVRQLLTTIPTSS